MQHLYAAPVSLSVEMGGVSPATGFVMGRTIAVMEQMNYLQHAVRYFITRTLSLFVNKIEMQ